MFLEMEPIHKVCLGFTNKNNANNECNVDRGESQRAWKKNYNRQKDYVQRIPSNVDLGLVLLQAVLEGEVSVSVPHILFHQY